MAVPFRKGADPRRGRGPKKGAPNAGRPPDDFKLYCQEIASTGAVAAARLLKRKNAEDHPAYLGALKWATEHGYGKPKESVEHTGKVTVKVVFGAE